MSISEIPIGEAMIDKWKLMISYLTAEHAGMPDKNGRFRVISTSEILPPKSVCTETYLIVFSSKSENEVKNAYSYLKCCTTRFLIQMASSSQHITRGTFQFVPLQDFTEPWSDEKLYKKYNLSQDEIAYIESLIKPME